MWMSRYNTFAFITFECGLLALKVLVDVHPVSRENTLGWERLIEEDLVELGAEIAIFDHMSAHVTDSNMEVLNAHNIHPLQGPPNGTDIWQQNDQLIIRELRREMRRLMTRYHVKNSGMDEQFFFNRSEDARAKRKVRFRADV